MEKSFWQRPAVMAGLAVVCCALWGSAFPCIKMGYGLLDIQDTGSQILFAGYRFFLAGVLTWVLGSVLEKRPLVMKKTSVLPVFGQGLLQTTVQYVFFYVGLAHCTGSKGSILDATSTFFAILLAHFVLKNERMTLRKGIGCLVGFLGVLVVNMDGLLPSLLGFRIGLAGAGATTGGFHALGEGFVLISAAAYGISSVTLKFITDKESPTTITAYQLMMGSAILIAAGFALGGHVTGFTWQSALLLLYMALLSTVAFSIWTTLLKYNPVSTVSVFSFSIPVFGSLLSGIFLQEQVFSITTLVALALVCVGIIIVNSRNRGCD